MKKILTKIIYLLSRSTLLYKTSKKIVDHHRNENNCELPTNGEGDFIEKNKKDFKVIFDVGANVGEWTELVSKTIPEARIYSFEPSVQTYKTLSQNSFPKNVSTFNLGLGEKNETIDFFIYGEDSTLNSAFNRDLENNNLHAKVEKANFQTLDFFCAEQNIDRISFLKIDTEGNELSVLRGATEYLKAGKVDAIQLEYGGTYIDAGYLLKDIFSFFKDKPYTLYKMMQHGLIECSVYNVESENFQYANYIAKLKK
ncbi:FkbM family methyltransferase [Arenimonas sp.]|nr:FkbM family methyltransferase [Candidatus Parcubacteria bacterium]